MDCKSYLLEQKERLGLASVAVKSLDHEFRADFAKDFDLYYGMEGVQLPEYVMRTISLRRDPAGLFPWARSVIMAAVPFSILPPVNNFIPKPPSEEVAGYVAGYAARLDYHVFAREVLGTLASGLMGYCFAAGTRYEICSDVSPVAERALAVSSGLGQVGRNSCIFTKSYGSECFIGEIFTEQDLEDFHEPPCKPPCQGCNACVHACPSGSLSSSGHFNMAICRSYISMEKRGPLKPGEISRLGTWVFGCDECTHCCPVGHKTEKVPVDLEWILVQPATNVRQSIKNTVIKHSGVTMLRRNAIAVLANKKNNISTQIIRKFASNTSSQALKEFSESLSR